MKILIINGPNLNMLGSRNRKIYGNINLAEISSNLKRIAKKENINLIFFQSNHEGDIIDFLQKDESRKADGILINPGALTHYGYSLRDALLDINLPTIEVHLSEITKRETFRKTDVLEGISKKRIMGKKDKSYYEGLEILINYIKKL